MLIRMQLQTVASLRIRDVQAWEARLLPYIPGPCWCMRQFATVRKRHWMLQAVASQDCCLTTPITGLKGPLWGVLHG